MTNEEIAIAELDINQASLLFTILSIAVVACFLNILQDDVKKQHIAVVTEFIVLAVILIVRYIKLKQLSKLRSHEKSKHTGSYIRGLASTD